MSTPTMELLPLTQTDIELAAGAERARFMPLMRMEEALARRELLVQAFSQLMKEGEDYGLIPGSKKPTLLQPGAQKLDNLFGLVPRYEIIQREEDWLGERHGGEPFFRYLIRCQTMRGDFVSGESFGECNSWEAKYRWRTADRVCPNCGKATILWTKKQNWWCNKHKGGCSSGFRADDERLTKQETGRQRNAEIFDQINTLLKMAQKRGHLGATINATSASEFVTQDLEDVPASPAEASEPAPEAQGGPSAGVAPAGNPPRPVPEELRNAYEHIAEKGHAETAFKFLQDELILAAGKEGDQTYLRVIGELRIKYPRGFGFTVPVQVIRTALLDLYDELTRFRKLYAKQPGPEPEKVLAQGTTRLSELITDDDVPF